MFSQTFMGMTWYVLNPVITMVLYVLVFSGFAKISTDDVPPVLFYFSGIILWNFFANNLQETSVCLESYQNILSKVYFPRIIIPVVVLLENLVELSISFGIFIILWIYFIYIGYVSFQIEIILTHLIVLLLAAFSSGLGMFMAAHTVKYKDLRNLLQFATKLLMYITPIMLPSESCA